MAGAAMMTRVMQRGMDWMADDAAIGAAASSMRMSGKQIFVTYPRY
jgi:hypothetical protein